MGAWSGEPFGNDSAADWAWELDDAGDWSIVREALDAVLEPGGADDDDVAALAIAAAEVVAHGLGRPTQEDAYTDEVAAFVERVATPPDDLAPLALRALAAASADDGALAGLWADAGDDSWATANARLADVLRGSVTD